jgi:hypothetical protein
MTTERIIAELQDTHGAVITKGVIHYNVTIWDHTIDAYQELELTEDELIDLYTEYYDN